MQRPRRLRFSSFVHCAVAFTVYLIPSGRARRLTEMARAFSSVG